MASPLDMPYEVLEHVMSFLPYADKKSARLVCRYWRDVSYSAKIIQNEVFRLKRCQDLNKLIDSDRKYFNVEILDDEEGGSAVEFWDNCGKYVKYLKMHFQSCSVNEVFTNTPNLEELELCRWDDHVTEAPILAVVPFTLQKLLKLCFNFERLRGDEFLMFVENTSRLEELTLNLGSDIVASDLLDAMEAFFKSQRNTLQRLNIPCCQFEDFQLMKILSNLGPQMVELRLSDCNTLTDMCIHIIQEKMPNLTKLDLGSAQAYIDLTDEGLHSLLRSLKQLTHICLAMSLLGEHTASLIPTMQNLCSLDLSHMSDEFDKRWLRQAFGTQHLPQLTELRMSWRESTEEADQILADILPFMPNLKFMHLQTFIGWSDLTVKHVADFCKKLRVLSLSDCSKIQDISPLNTLANLEYLSLRVSDDGNFSYSQLQMLKLKEIVVNQYFNSGSNDSTFESLAKNCPSLKNVYTETTSNYEEPPARSHPFKIHNVGVLPLWDKGHMFDRNL